MYLPSGVYSGPSSSPLKSVSRVSSPLPSAAIGATAGVVDERAAVARPVGRFEGLGRAQDALPAAGRDVEDLQDASDVVPVGHEAFLRRTDDPDVAERGLLDDARIVRAEEEASVDLVAQGQIGELALGHGIAEAGDGHRVGVPLPLQLDEVGSGDGRLD